MEPSQLSPYHTHCSLFILHFFSHLLIPLRFSPRLVNIKSINSFSCQCPSQSIYFHLVDKLSHSLSAYNVSIFSSAQLLVSLIGGSFHTDTLFLSPSFSTFCMPEVTRSRCPKCLKVQCRLQLLQPQPERAVLSWWAGCSRWETFLPLVLFPVP